MYEKYKEVGLMVARWSNIKEGNDADSEVDFIIDNAEDKAKVGFLSGAGHDICMAVVSMIAAGRDEEYIMSRIKGRETCYDWMMPSVDLNNDDTVGCIILPIFMSYAYSQMDKQESQYSLFLGQSESKIRETVMSNPIASLVRSILTDSLSRNHEPISQYSIDVLAKHIASLEERASEPEHAKLLSALSLPPGDTNHKDISESYIDIISALSFAFIKMNGGEIGMDVFVNLVKTVVEQVPSYASVASKVKLVALDVNGKPNLIAHSIGLGMEL